LDSNLLLWTHRILDCLGTKSCPKVKGSERFGMLTSSWSTYHRVSKKVGMDGLTRISILNPSSLFVNHDMDPLFFTYWENRSE
jgi:hypothetical protein